MKKTTLTILATTLLLLVACSKNELNGTSWLRQRIHTQETDTYNHTEETRETLRFDDNKNGNLVWEYHLRHYYVEEDSTAQYDTTSLRPFTYTYSRGAGVLSFTDGDIQEINMRDNHIIYKGTHYRQQQ